MYFGGHLIEDHLIGGFNHTIGKILPIRKGAGLVRTRQGNLQKANPDNSVKHWLGKDALVQQLASSCQVAEYPCGGDRCLHLSQLEVTEGSGS